MKYEITCFNCCIVGYTHKAQTQAALLYYTRTLHFTAQPPSSRLSGYFLEELLNAFICYKYFFGNGALYIRPQINGRTVAINTEGHKAREALMFRCI